MKQYPIYSPLVTLLILTGCTNNDNDETSTDRIPVHIQAGITTRVSGTQWENDDIIGLYMTSTGTGNIAEGVDNYPYVTGGDGTFKPDNPSKVAFYPLGSDKVDLHAYYPWSTQITGSIINIDVSDQSNPDMDLLTAKVIERSNQAKDAHFKFRHRLAKLSFTLDGSGVNEDVTGAIITVEDVSLQGNYNLLSDVLTPGQTKTTIDVPSSGNNYSIILLPGYVDSGVKFVVTLKDGNTFTASIPSGTEFQAGVNNKFTLNLRAQSIKITAEIEDWDEGSDNGLDTWN